MLTRKQLSDEYLCLGNAHVLKHPKNFIGTSQHMLCKDRKGFENLQHAGGLREETQRYNGYRILYGLGYNDHDTGN